MRSILPLLTVTLLSTASLSLGQTPEPAAAPTATPAAMASPSASPAAKRVRHKKLEAAAPAASPAAAASPAEGSAPATSPAPGKMTKAERKAAKKEKMDQMDKATPAPGGGPGMVWVNTKSKVYHDSTSRFYGKTKEGKYMTEEAAKAEGDHEAKAEIGKAKPAAQ